MGAILVPLYLISEQKLIKTVRVPLDAAHGALEGVNISEAEDLAIAGAAQSPLILLILDGSHFILDFTSEELIESAELIDVLDLNLIKVDAIELSEP